MTPRQKLILALVMPVTLALVALLAIALARPIPAAPIRQAPAQFDADRALKDAVQLAADYPDRVVGSPTSARARAWIIQRFTDLGLKVETLPFTVRVASQARSGVQVWATSPGPSGEIALVTAHYDVPQTGVPGAADDASGIGTLLELARVFAAAPHRRTLIFMASDSEEYGSFWGAKNFIEHFDRRDKIIAVLDLDYLSARDLKRINLSSVGLQRGYTPLWLRQVGLGAIEAAGVSAGEAEGVLEYLYRAVPIGAADYSMYLRAGIPAVNFGGEPADTAAWIAEYHTPLDTPDKLRASAFAGYGRAAEIWLRSVDALDPILSYEPQYFRLNRARYLPGPVMDVLQLLVFTPLFFAAGMAWQTGRPRRDELRPEFMAFLGLVVTGLDGYAIAYSLVNLRLLPVYELYPASPGDPFLLHPAGWAALAIYGTMALFGWLIFRPYRGWGRLADILEVPHRRTALLLLFSALVIGLWFLNGFSASALLGPAAYLWVWIEPHERLWRKALNLGLALAGALPFAACVYFFASNFPIGPWWWYLTLGAAYGLFPLLAVVAFLCGAALLLRFARHGLRDP